MASPGMSGVYPQGGSTGIGVWEAGDVRSRPGEKTGARASRVYREWVFSASGAGVMGRRGRQVSGGQINVHKGTVEVHREPMEAYYRD